MLHPHMLLLILSVLLLSTRSTDGTACPCYSNADCNCDLSELSNSPISMDQMMENLGYDKCAEYSGCEPCPQDLPSGAAAICLRTGMRQKIICARCLPLLIRGTPPDEEPPEVCAEMAALRPFWTKNFSRPGNADESGKLIGAADGDEEEDPPVHAKAEDLKDGIGIRRRLEEIDDAAPGDNVDSHDEGNGEDNHDASSSDAIDPSDALFYRSCSVQAESRRFLNKTLLFPRASPQDESSAVFYFLVFCWIGFLSAIWSLRRQQAAIIKENLQGFSDHVSGVKPSSARRDRQQGSDGDRGRKNVMAARNSAGVQRGASLTRARSPDRQGTRDASSELEMPEIIGRTAGKNM